MDEKSYNIIRRKILNVSRQASLLFSMAGSMDSSDNFYTNVCDNLFDSNSYRKSPEEILKNIFGYESFRPLQKEIIENVLNKKDTLAVMPTGGGKSLCYQIPALIMDGITLVVSPLIALMQDQVSQLETLGIPAVYLNSTLEWEEYVETCTKITGGQIKLLYLSPEALNTQKIISLLTTEGVKINCITIDEAHCISSWGHDFRPDYLEIKNLRNYFPDAVFLALTATATKNVQQDIVSQLRMKNPAMLFSGFNRPNIFLNVKRKNHGLQQVCEFLNNHQGQSGIIYCFSRKSTDTLYEQLKELNYNVTNYHAGLSDEVRAKNQNDFITDKIQIIVSTLAFGMGINKPDVRFVIHYDMPKSLEQYYQEIGRAGRDGLDAEALLLFSPGDAHKIRFLFQDQEDSSNSERLLRGMLSFAESNECRRKTLLRYFGEEYTPNESPFLTQRCCDICSFGPVQASDVTIPAQKFMSCIARTHQHFGANYVIDVLLGSKSERISENDHDLISTYGIGKELKKSQWQELNRCLQNEGYVGKTEEYNMLFLTPKGYTALTTRQPFILPVHFDLEKEKSEKEFGKEKKYSIQKKPSLFIASDDLEGQRIVSELRKWRVNLAEEMNVPPYIIFGDKTMYDIASKKPHTMSRLLECYGIGENKAEKFGSDILDIVNETSQGWGY